MVSVILSWQHASNFNAVSWPILIESTGTKGRSLSFSLVVKGTGFRQGILFVNKEAVQFV